MDAGVFSEWVILTLTPTLAAGVALSAPRLLRALRRRKGRQRLPAPVGPPIEEVAADLRRLLQRHQALRHSADVAMRARKMHALEAAISDCAVDAAAALEVPCPAHPGRRALSMPELRRLLHSLAGAGLMIEPLTGVFAA